MTDFYFCPRTELSVHKENNTVHPMQIGELKVKDLLEHRIRAFGYPVKIEKVDEERIRFLFRGVDHNRIFGQDEPAENLLRGIANLGGHYDRKADKFYF